MTSLGLEKSVQTEVKRRNILDGSMNFIDFWEVSLKHQPQSVIEIYSGKNLWKCPHKCRIFNWLDCFHFRWWLGLVDWIQHGNAVPWKRYWLPQQLLRCDDTMVEHQNVHRLVLSFFIHQRRQSHRLDLSVHTKVHFYVAGKRLHAHPIYETWYNRNRASK